MTEDEWLSPAAMLAWRSFLEVHAQLMPIVEEQFTRDGGISHAQYGILLSLQAEPQGLTMKELAAAVFVSKSGLTYQVDRLVDGGFVTRAVDPDDERRRVVRITREGFAVLAAIRPGHIETLREYFVGSLSPTEVEHLAHGLAAVSRGLEARGERQKIVPLYRDDAIVLRTHKLGEADRIVTMLTKNHGKVRAVAKGVRKTSSRLGARVEPFMLADVQLYEGRNLDIVSQVETREPYARRIVSDYALYTAATAMVETADKLVDHEKEPAYQQFRLLHGALGALSRREHDPGSLLDSFLLRSLAIAGYAPSFDECAVCGKPGPHRAFAIAEGGAVCEDCRPSGAAAPSPETFALLGALLEGNWVVADGAESRARRDAAGIVAAYTQYHLERKVRSLPLVDRES